VIENGRVSRFRSDLLLVVAVLVGTVGAVACSPAGGRPSTEKIAAPTTFTDVPYGSASPLQKLDLYLPPARQSKAPLVIWIHGGGWRTGDKSDINQSYDPSITPPKPTRCNQVVQVQSPDVRAMNAKGYAVAAINYRINRDPIAAVQDAKAAVRFLRANAAKYQLDPQRFAAWGESAGGYSAIMLGLTGAQRTVFDDGGSGDAPVQAVVDWFGPTDFSSMPGRLGPPESPYTYIKPGEKIPPFTIANGTADCVVPLWESQRLADALKKAGAMATLTVLAGAQHEDPAFMRTQLAPAVAFLDRTLR
jgi:acetyl esterase/lipase